jgi:hypothetical protein
MTAHVPESPFVWPIDPARMTPPRNPHDDHDTDDGENDDDESEGEEPAVIREPDDESAPINCERHSEIEQCGGCAHSVSQGLAKINYLTCPSGC